MSLTHLLTLIVAAVLCAGICLSLVAPARKLGLIDVPDQRKVHEAPTPLTGGLAIFITFALISLVIGNMDRLILGLLTGGAVVVVVGVIDDRHELPPWARFAAQVLASGIVMLIADLRLEDFGQLFTSQTLELGPAATLITLFAALGVINSFNMIDGMDGLAGTLFTVAGAGLILVCGHERDWGTLWLLSIACAAVAGFLVLNARFPWNSKARVFLGDSGSTLLGFLLAWFCIATGSERPYIWPRLMMPMTAVWLVAVPLLDTSVLIWRRLRSGKSAFAADQYHLHHAFHRAGFSVRATWLMITTFAIALAATGLAFEYSSLPDYYSFWAFIAIAFAYYFYLKRAWQSQRFLGRDFVHNKPEVVPPIQTG